MSLHHLLMLTTAALLNSLQKLAAARDEKTSRIELVTTATLIQQTVLHGGDAAEFEAALDQVPASLDEYLQAALNRTVEFQVRDDGSSLGLWLVPVVVDASAGLPSILPLETKSMNYLKMTGELVKQMGTGDAAARVDAGQAAGWNYIVPTLYSLEQITGADLYELVSLPQRALALVRGECKTVEFNVGTASRTVDASALYFLPVVVNHAEGAAIRMPLVSDIAASRLTKWVQQTLGTDVSVVGGAQPHPFSVALDAGERLQLSVKTRTLLGQTCEKLGVHAHGMAALVAPYALSNGAQFVLGITMVSRMTKQVLATLSLPVNTDGVAEAELAAQVLRDGGLQSVQVHTAPVESLACQSCGELQFAMPSPEVAARGVLAQACQLQ